MKTIFLKSYRFIAIVLFSVTVLNACNDDDVTNQATAPSIEFISASVDTEGKPVNPLTPTNIGYANNTYVIKGKGFASLKKVYFNDTESYFNPNLVTDTHIIVTINANTPYNNVSNKLRLETGYGSVEKDFTVAPPAPVFDGFNPINANDGDEVVLKGNYFVNPKITVGDTPAEIISISLTEMKVKLPAGSQGKKMTVTTLSGAVTYPSQVGTSLYDDIFYGDITNSTWSGDLYNIAYSDKAENIKQGKKAIQWEVKAWSAFQFDSSPTIPANAKGIRFYAKADAETKNIRLILNYSWGTTPSIDISKTYGYFEIPWDKFGLSAPPSTMNITLNNNNGTTNTIYLDDLGYYY